MNIRSKVHASLSAATLLTLSLVFANSANAIDDRRTVQVALSGPTLLLDLLDAATTKGGHFIVEGVIYPAGTLEHCDALGDSCGWTWNADGELVPEYPEKVIGHFTCSGWLLSTDGWDQLFPALLSALATGDFADVQSWLERLRGERSVRVTQTYDFAYGSSAGDHMLMTDGFELFSLPGDSVSRPVIGGTGIFENVRGASILTSISAVNGSGASTIAVTFPSAVWN